MNNTPNITPNTTGLGLRLRVADLVHDASRVGLATDLQRNVLAAAFTAAADDMGALQAHDAAAHAFRIAATIFRGDDPDAAALWDLMARANAQLA